MSTTARNTNSMEKDLEKFIKFLALKSAQVVVQSRLGEKLSTPSNPHSSGNDWFNVVIQDHPDVLYETKKALGVTAGGSILSNLPLCIEISLQTVDGDKMVLEVWSLGIYPDQSDPNIRSAHAIYNRMGIVLKSLISITRATPAYKLSRRQSPDSYHIYYRIYVDEPQTHNLGEGYKQVRVGQLCTTLGRISMSVAFRTKMTISPTQTGRDNKIMLKSDHFLKDLSPKHARYHHIKKSEKKVIDLEKPLRPGAFVDTSKLKQYTEEDYILPETPPFSWLIRKTKETSSQETSTEDEKPSNIISTNNDKTNTDKTTETTTNNNNSNFKSLESTDIKLFTQNGQKDISGTSPTDKSLDSREEKRNPSRWSKPIPPEDEKLLADLVFPFAENTNMDELASFFRECLHAPKLQAYYNPSPPAEEEVDEIEDLDEQLEEFETNLGEYDLLVTSFDCSSVDNNSNS